MDDNFYTILNLEEDASQDEIKKSYRRLSLKHHPDKNRGNMEAVKIFQKVNEAYATLSDTERKKEYDFSRKHPQQGNFGMNMDMDDLLSKLFFGGLPVNQMGNMGHMSHMNMGQGPNIHIFRQGQGIGGNFFQPEKPPPIVVTIVVSVEIVLSGGKLPIDIERWAIEGHNKVFESLTLYVDIMQGIDNNEVIVLKDQGHIASETCKGDIKVQIKVEQSTLFERRGLDLYYKKEISLLESLCGFSFELSYVNGKSYTINNQAGKVIPPGYHKVIPNMGITREGLTGNMVIVFHVAFPEAIATEDISVLYGILKK